MALSQNWSSQQITNNSLQGPLNENNFDEVRWAGDFHKHSLAAIHIISAIIVPSSNMTTETGVFINHIPLILSLKPQIIQHKMLRTKYMLFPLVLGFLVMFSGCGSFPFGLSAQKTPTLSPIQAVAATATVSAQTYTTETARQGVMDGFNAAHTNDNPYEHILNPENVSRLTLLWSFAIGGGTAPVVDGGMVYIGGQSFFDPVHNKSISPKLYAFDANCRKACQPLWSFDTGDVVFSTPAVAGGMVYIGINNGNIDAFDANCRKACQPLWSYSTGSDPIESSLTVAGGMVYVGSFNGKFYSFDASCRQACQPLWSFATGAPIVFSTPTVAGSMVYVGSLYGKFYAFDASCRQACQPLWSFATGSSITSSPTVDGGMVYVGAHNHRLYAFDATCRQTCQPLWTFTAEDEIDSAPAIADGIVYIHSADHKLYAFDATCRQTCQPLWSFFTYGNTGEPSPVVAGNVVYVGSSNYQFYAFDATCRQACQPLWSFATGNNIPTPPAIANGVVYINTQEGLFYALGLIA